MIQDAATKEKLVQEWHFGRRSKAMLESRAVASLGRGSVGMVGMYDEYYALLLVLAFSVLEHALEVLRDEGTFNARGWQLITLMEASRDEGVRWQNFQAVNASRDARNGLAHRQIIPKTDETFRMLDEIEAELIGWNVLPGPVQYESSSSIGRT
jgi:hypothetical protein